MIVLRFHFQYSQTMAISPTNSLTEEERKVVESREESNRGRGSESENSFEGAKREMEVEMDEEESERPRWTWREKERKRRWIDRVKG